MLLRSGNLDCLIDVAEEEVSLGYSVTLLHTEVSLIPLMIIFTQARLTLRSGTVVKDTELSSAGVARARRYLNRQPLDAAGVVGSALRNSRSVTFTYTFFMQRTPSSMMGH